MDTLNRQFGLNDYTTMHFGASLFDLRAMDINIKMLSYVYDSLSAINSGHMPDIFAGTLWVTGDPQREFSWRNRVGLFKRCYECLGKDGFIHTSEFLVNSDVIPFLFSHLRWFENDRIIHDASYLNLNLYQVGALQQTWTVDPISIRYYLKMVGNLDSPDYLYLLGGSPDLFNYFNPNDEDHLTAYYGFYRYLIVARDKLGLNRVYEKNGSVERAIDISFLIEEIKEYIHEVL